MDTDNITIKDKEGRVRLFLGLDQEDNPQIQLYDSQGKARIAFKLSEDHLFASFYDRERKSGIEFFVGDISKTTLSAIQLRDKDKCHRVNLTLECEPACTRGAMGVFQKHCPPYISFGFTESEERTGCGGSILGTDSGPGLYVEVNARQFVTQFHGDIVIDSQSANIIH